MANGYAESLSQLVTTSQERLAELALAGDQAVLIAAAQAAADAALELARHSLALVRKLELGARPVGTGIWLCGAFELALGRRADAVSTFTDSLQRYRDAGAPGLGLLTEGYLAIARGEDVENVCARIAAGGFQDGSEWIEQLQVAAQVFAAIPRWLGRNSTVGRTA